MYSLLGKHTKKALNIAIYTHFNWLIYPLKPVIFHSFMFVYQENCKIIYTVVDYPLKTGDFP